jgi:hypothetical protein
LSPPAVASPVSSYRVTFVEPHDLADGDTTLTVDDYEDVGSMYILELPAGTTRSVGKQLVASVEPAGTD